MRVVLLAAGRGSRLGAQTQVRPKCMTVLIGRPWLDWQLDALKGAGVKSVTLVTGHAAHAIPTHELIDQRIHQPAWARCGPASSLWAALCHLPDQPLIVAYADCLWHAEWIKRLCAARGPIAITSDDAWLALWSERFPSPLDDAESFRWERLQHRSPPNYALTSIGQRTANLADIEGQFMGLMHFTVEGSAQLRRCLADLVEDERDRLDMTALLTRLLAQGKCIEVVRGAGAWIELDHASDLALYERRGLDPKWSHDWRRAPA